MRKQLISIIVAVFILCVVTDLSHAALKKLKDKVLFWGFDKIYVGDVHNKSVDLKPVLDGTIDNIVAVSTNGDLISIVGFYPTSNKFKFSIVLTDTKYSKLSKLLELDGIYGAALSPSGKYIAFLTVLPPLANTGHGKEAYDVCIYDIARRTYDAVVRRKALRYSGLSWKPKDEEVTYTTVDGFIESVDIFNAPVL